MHESRGTQVMQIPVTAAAPAGGASGVRVTVHYSEVNEKLDLRHLFLMP